MSKNWPTTLLHAPLPTWANIFRSLRTPPSDEQLTAPWCREGDVAGWLSRSAWSLALIALWRKKITHTSTAVVWVPDLFCNASLFALRHCGTKLVFYPVTEKMLPDIAACRVLAQTAPPDILIAPHYFGQPKNIAVVRDFCAHHGSWLIEDAAHVLRPVGDIGTFGDFVLYSAHKHLPIPDGAILVIRANGPGKLGNNGIELFGLPSGWPDQLVELARQLGCVRGRRLHAIIWLGKRVLQKLGVRPLYRSASSGAKAFDGSPQLTTPIPSRLSRSLLSGLIGDLGATARYRQRNQLLWDALLTNEAACGLGALIAAERPEGRFWTPYLSSYLVTSLGADDSEDQLNRLGLPVSTWPDLPPEVSSDREHHLAAWHLRHGRIYLPVHQSLNAAQLLERCPSSPDVPKHELRLRLVWDDASREEWCEWLAAVERSNLLQSWAYGEAKSATGGWRVKRGVFYHDHEPIALVQVLQKCVAGVLKIARINRGPLPLRSLQFDETRAIWEELALLGDIMHGRVLALAPELSLSGSSLALLEKCGFRQFSPYAMETVWIDLGNELDVLRKRLDGKWRNMLAFSEKAGLALEMGCDEQFVDWMLRKYQKLMQEKDFAGPPISILRALRNHHDERKQLLVFRAVHENEPVAGICVARHGVAATYLLGWNGSKGRSLKANQYLLWQAIRHLKSSGTRWFDLGGISEESTPGITAFKLGMNGERYELVGEYWKW